MTASAAAVTAALYLGATASRGLGEARLSPTISAQIDTARLRGVVSYDRSVKVESGKGWIAGGSVAVKAGKARLGAAYVHRDGGAWVKDTLWAEPGVAFGDAVEVTLRAAVAGATAAEHGARVRVGLGRHVRWEGQILRHHAGQLGYTSALSLRVGR